VGDDPKQMLLYYHDGRWTLVWRDNGFLIEGDTDYEALKSRVAEVFLADLDQVERVKRNPWDR